MALTLDGKIARNDQDFPDWTEKADKQYFVRRTKEAGVMIMGSKTFQTLPGALPNRKTVVVTRTPKESGDSNLWYTDLPPKDIFSQLEKEGFREVIIAGGAAINTLFIKAGLVDQIEVTLSPLVFGEGLNLFTERIDVPLTLQNVAPLGDNSLLAVYALER